MIGFKVIFCPLLLLSYNLDCLAFGEGSVFGLLGVFFCLFWGFFFGGTGI
jgi:hypothetical protein